MSDDSTHSSKKKRENETEEIKKHYIPFFL